MPENERYTSNQILYSFLFFSTKVEARYLGFISCLCSSWSIFSVCFHNHVEEICIKTLLEKIGCYISSKQRILFSSCSWMCWSHEFSIFYRKYDIHYRSKGGLGSGRFFKMYLKEVLMKAAFIITVFQTFIMWNNIMF